jgi:CRP-like cAMP-binding protein
MSTAHSVPPDGPGPRAGDGLAGLAGLAELAELAEADLPAGSRLADERRPGHQCFFILDGTATVERDGRRLRRLAAGAFVGELDPGDRPLPMSGVTVRLDARSRVLVLDPARLAAAIEADPVLAAAWRSVAART